MKKMYSLFATVMVATGIFAQTLFSANFNDVIGTGGNDGLWNGSIAASGFANGSTSYTTGGAWTLSNTFKGNNCLKLGTGSLKGSVTTPSIATGNASEIKLSFRAGAWDGASESTSVKIIATGATFGGSNEVILPMSKGSFFAFTINNIQITGSGPVTFTFQGNAVANNRFFIDDISVEKTSTLAVADINKIKSNFIKNTFVKNNEITFGAQSKEVKIYNMLGQVVKTASVKQNETLNVSDLAKGSYIVTGNVNNQPVSQKILKD
jgi:hypothetical protein